MGTLRFILVRLLNFVLVVWVGVTVVFVLMRLIPTDPIEALIGSMTSQGTIMSEAALDEMRRVLSDAFGLHGSIWEQYGRYLYRNFVSFDFGPSFSSFPTPVSELIGRAVPWTIGLLITSTVIGWVVGNVIGLLAGVYPNRRLSKAVEFVAIFVYPLPYYVLALGLSIVLSYTFRVFPLSAVVIGEPWTLQFVWNVIYNSTLPALSIVIGLMGWWVISVKALSSGVQEEEFVRFARLRGVAEHRVLTQYILRNTLLPQVTVLAIQIGLIFSGSILTEILFQYPGLGTLIFSAVVQGDYNLMMGVIQISIIAVAGAIFLVDLTYPFIDPRIRYR